MTRQPLSPAELPGSSRPPSAWPTTRLRRSRRGRHHGEAGGRDAEDRLRERGVRRWFPLRFRLVRRPHSASAGHVRPSNNPLNDILNPKMAHSGSKVPPHRPPVAHGRRRDPRRRADRRTRPDMGYLHARRADAGVPRRPDGARAAPPRDPRDGGRGHPGAIHHRIDEIIADQGYENIHSYYPGAVMAHRGSGARCGCRRSG